MNDNKLSQRQESFLAWTLLLSLAAVLGVGVVAFGMWVF